MHDRLCLAPCMFPAAAKTAMPLYLTSPFLAALGYGEHEVRRAGSSQELASFLRAPLGSEARPKVVLTTLQKLATVWRSQSGARGSGKGGGSGKGSSGNLAAKGGTGGAGGGAGAQGGQARGVQRHRIAVIADEAHRSHGHSTTELTHQLLASAAAGLGDQEDVGEAGAGPGGPSDGLGQSGGVGAGGGGGKAGKHAKSGKPTTKQPKSVTYIGFTATPSPKALQLFGVATKVICDALGDVVGSAADGDAGMEGHNGSTTGGEGEDGVDGLEDRPQKLEPAVQYAPFHVYSMQKVSGWVGPCNRGCGVVLLVGLVVHVPSNFAPWAKVQPAYES